MAKRSGLDCPLLDDSAEQKTVSKGLAIARSSAPWLVIILKSRTAVQRPPLAGPYIHV
jgi:hypothetical protein